MSVPIQVLRDDGSQELKVSTAVTVLSMMVNAESAGGFILKSIIISTVLSRLSSRLSSRLLFILLSVSRLVTVLDEADECGIICRLQELDRGVCRCAVVGVEREE